MKFNTKKSPMKNYIRTKLESYNENSNTEFHNKRMSKDGSRCIYLLVVLLNCVSFLKFFYMCFKKNANSLWKKKIGNFDCGPETEHSETNFYDGTFDEEKKL